MKSNQVLAMLFFNSGRRTNVVRLLLIIFIVCFVLMANKSGPAKNGSAVTGAPFNYNRTCASCHNGGSFGGTITTSLVDANNNVVTNYIPSKSYTLKITFGHTNGSPGYGFQTTAATSGASANINNWGVLPANIHTIMLTGHTYVEHSAVLNSNVISLPWRAPAANTGTVVFYTAGNLVNSNGNMTGDEPVNTSLTVAESQVLAVSLLYFKGSIVNGKAILAWATAHEVNNKNFVIEKSIDGIHFTQMATINAKTNSTGNTYSYTDAVFKNIGYYRLKQVDKEGNTTVYNVVELKNISAGEYTAFAYSHDGNIGVLFYNPAQQQKITVRCANMQGKILYSYTTVANEGNNFLPLSATASKEILVITIITESGVKKSVKVGVIR